MYRKKGKSTWCKGCTYHVFLAALTGMFTKRAVPPEQIAVISGIGCSSRLPFFLATSALHTLHGRALPLAIGYHLAQPRRHIVVIGGDGDLFSIGTSHFVHAARKNFAMTVICLDNQLYAMTKNQASPTSPPGYCGTLSREEEPGIPLNTVEFAIACNASFVAQTFTGAPMHCGNVLGRAFDHDGFAFVNVLAPCRRFNGTSPLFAEDREIVDINKQSGLDVANRESALAWAGTLPARQAEEKIAVGVFHEALRPTFGRLITQSAYDAAGEKCSVASIIDRFSVDND